MRPVKEEDLKIYRAITKRFVIAVEYVLNRPKVFEITSKQQLADELVMVRETIYDYINGEQNVTIPQANRMCEKFGFEVMWMYLGKGKRRKPNKI